MRLNNSHISSKVTRARGRKGGRPSLPDYKKREIKFLYDEQKLTGEEIAKQTGVSRSTVYRIIKIKEKKNGYK
ncbi:resolvase [Staphylococcus aureus]|nr:resolvase [Staphylococcus aureus]